MSGGSDVVAAASDDDAVTRVITGETTVSEAAEKAKTTQQPARPFDLYCGQLLLNLTSSEDVDASHADPAWYALWRAIVAAEMGGLGGEMALTKTFRVF